MGDCQWIFSSQPQQLVQTLSRELRVSPLLSRMLINRGIDDTEAAEHFLHPTIHRLHDPMKLGQMDKAVARIRRAIKDGEHIRTQGDYDVDGSTSCALLDQFFSLVGAKHSFSIPRRSDGYGLSHGAIERAHADGVTLLLTVDNGISAHDEIAHAVELGMDVIVTDHHTVGETLPRAHAIIHPSLPGYEYPFSGLCGCAVAFKLALAIATSYGDTNSLGPRFTAFLENALALVAVASVCDVVNLVDENRILVRHGLAALETANHPGLRALLDAASVVFPVDVTDVGFRIGPRLNAGGRMGHESLAAELLTCEDPARAADLAQEMDRLNTQRQKVERDATRVAKAMVEERGNDDDFIVVAHEDFAPGVVGIVAARLVDAFSRPSLVLAINNEEGVATGSGRSTPDFHLLDALKQCESRFTRYGGHAQAAGVTIRREQIPGLQEELNAASRLSESFVSQRKFLQIDSLVDPEELCLSMVEEIARLEPFGQGNPEPLLALEAGRIVGRPRVVGKTGKHLSFLVSPGGGPAYRAIGFRLAEHFEAVNRARDVDLVFCPRISRFRGDPELEIEVRDVVVRA